MTMTPLYPGLPGRVTELIQSSMFSEFATVSAQGIPIDTPAFSFLDFERGSIDIATGLSYPAKAERARRNPKVGLLIEGLPDEPMISIAALAAVRDADIQANVDRYVAETIAYFDAYSYGTPWALARQSVWYWARIFVCCQPQRILWWSSPAHMDAPPLRWDAPAETSFPPSDPAPAGPTSSPPVWPTRPWRERAGELLSLGVHAHLTTIDTEGFPLPLRARSVTLEDAGFSLGLPSGVPWPIRGKASLSFAGAATFIGEVRSAHGGAVFFAVERILPTLPTVADPRELWSPSHSTRNAFMGRLAAELQRRRLGLPQVCEQPPTPTRGSLLRAGRIARLTSDTKLKQGAN